jgi:hypothetical protein
MTKEESIQKKHFGYMLKRCMGVSSYTTKSGFDRVGGGGFRTKRSSINLNKKHESSKIQIIICLKEKQFNWACANSFAGLKNRARMAEVNH